MAAFNMRRRRSRARPPSRPWTPEEDEKLREVNALGLVSEAWHHAIPDRPLHEMFERRLELGIKPRALL